MEKDTDKKDVLKLALAAGEILLKNGAETYRTEQTVEMICRSRGFEGVHSFVTPTGIFISEDQADGISYLKRIRSRTIHLEKIARINALSKTFVASDMEPALALKAIEDIESTEESERIRVVSGALAAGFFAVLFGGGMLEFALALPVAALAILCADAIGRLSRTPFLANAAAGALIAFLGLLVEAADLGASVDPVIIGAIMPHVPGVALVTGLRDFIEGDLLAGTSRVAEAGVIAVSIAVGVGAVIQLWALFGGLL